MQNYLNILFRHSTNNHYYIFFIIYLILSLSWISCSGPPRYTQNGPDTIQPSGTHYKKHKNASDPLPPKNNRHTSGTFLKKGNASYYGAKFHGKKTASGEYFDQYKMTAAHNTLPFGTMVKVTNLKNNCTVTVRINDRGPHKPDRIIDVSFAAAKQLDMIQYGIVPVTITVVSPLSN